MLRVQKGSYGTDGRNPVKMCTFLFDLGYVCSLKTVKMVSFTVVDAGL